MESSLTTVVPPPHRAQADVTSANASPAETAASRLVLTPLQLAFFETFGYLVLRGAMADDIGWIIDEFEAAWRARPDITHDGSLRTMFPGNMIEQRRRLTTLLDHPVVTGCADGLLGAGWTFCGGDGNFYAGDTGWHSDLAPGAWESKNVCRHLKIAFYLDPLTPTTGALRVIPGSHIRGDRYAELLEQLTPWMNKGDRLAGLPGPEVPCVALTQEPGDLVMFDHRTKHAAFGGNQRRRMFTMNLQAPCTTPEQRAAALDVFRYYRDKEKVPWQWQRAWLDAMTPGERRRLDLAIELSRIVRAEKGLAGDVIA